MYVKILSFLPNCDEIDMGQKYTKNMHTYWGMPADPRNTLRYTVERTCAMLRVTGYWLHPPTKQVMFNSNQLAATAALCSLTTNPKESKLDLQCVWICQMTELYTVDNHTLLLYVVIIIITHVICVHIYIYIFNT